MSEQYLAPTAAQREALLNAAANAVDELFDAFRVAADKSEKWVLKKVPLEPTESVLYWLFDNSIGPDYPGSLAKEAPVMGAYLPDAFNAYYSPLFLKKMGSALPRSILV